MSQKRQPKKYVRWRHRFFFWLLMPVARIFAWKYHFKTKRFKAKKGENYLILSNHQSYPECVLMSLTFRRPIYFVGSDILYSQKWYSRLLFWLFAPIKKRRGDADAACIRTMYRVAREGGNVFVAPEGNRQWNDSVFHIDMAVVKLIRLLKLPVALYTFRGGYGVNPRWGKKLRKGKHVGTVAKVISVAQAAQMTDEELLQTVTQTLKVIDADSGALYKSRCRAEYLERQLFICPKCQAFSTLYSHRENITCGHCGLTVTYGENLHLTARDPMFTFDKVVDWYAYQLQVIREYSLEPDKIILQDACVALYDKTTQQRVLLAKGKLTLTPETLAVGDWQLKTAAITGVAAQDGTKFSFNVADKSYVMIGNERFNGIKYVLFFNRVCAQIAAKGGDKYYGLQLDAQQC